jgi:hypothetical protein
MPHEILNLDTLYSSEQEEVLSSKPQRPSDLAAWFAASDTPVTQKQKQAIIYNFQHDLESIWWIFVWTATSRVAHEPSINFANKIFKNTTTLSKERADCMIKGIFGPLNDCLEPSLRGLALPLDKLRKLMFAHYVRRAKKDEIYDLGSYTEVHYAFASFFQGIKLSRATWGGTLLETDEPQPVDASPQDPPQPAVAALKIPKPGRGKRLRKRDNADYEPSEPETESEEVDSEEDKAKKKKGKKKGTRSRKKARTADAETGPQ